MQKSIRIGLLGHGVVGRGVAEILLEKQRELSHAAGKRIELVRILDAVDFPELPYAHLLTKDVADIVANPAVDIVVECLGGVEPAGGWALSAIRAGQTVVTSNKAMVVACGEAIEEEAARSGGGFFTEASVAGGIPILHPLRACLVGNRILRIGGILNGTTNYILTRMQGGAAPFEAALAEAQQLGYAERDPTADIEGHDARRKLAILAHVAFGASLSDDARIACTGIAREGKALIEREDMQYAAALSRTIRLVAMGELLPDEAEAPQQDTQEAPKKTGEACIQPTHQKTGEARWGGVVAPVMLPAGHPLAGVSDVFNAVLVKGDRVGDLMFYGPGAGKNPTASAVVGDIVEAARGGYRAAVASTAPTPGFSAQLSPTHWFMRVKARDTAAVQQALLADMPDARIISDIVPDELGLVTRSMSDAVLEDFLRHLHEKGLAHSVPIRYDNL